MWDDPKTMNALSVTLILCSLIALTAAALLWFARQPMFVFKEVLIKNVHRADPAHLVNVVRGELQGTFFTVNLNRAREALKRVPWVATADLYRNWPNRLEIAVHEYVPFAEWNNKALVTEDARIFHAPYDGELPVLTGADSEVATVVARFRTWRQELQQHGLVLTAVHCSPRGSWSLTVDNGGNPQTIELGRVLVEERVERLVRVYAQTVGLLVAAGYRVDAIDLRYSQGLAVQHSPRPESDAAVTPARY